MDRGIEGYAFLAMMGFFGRSDRHSMVLRGRRPLRAESRMRRPAPTHGRERAPIAPTRPKRLGL
jgi:hypothetical protein